MNDPNLSSFIWSVADLLRIQIDRLAKSKLLYLVTEKFAHIDLDHGKTKFGYEIPFNRHFYVFKPPRDPAEIDAELRGVTDRILTMIGGP